MFFLDQAKINLHYFLSFVCLAPIFIVLIHCLARTELRSLRMALVFNTKTTKYLAEGHIASTH